MTIPNYITNGAYTKTFEATITNVLVVAPAGVTAGNRLLLVTGTRSTSTAHAAAYNAPTGWVNVASVSRNTGAELRIWTKTADGTESSLTHTISVSNGGPGAALTAVMWMFDSTADSYESINSRNGGSTTVSAVDVITGGTDRLAINVLFTQNQSTLTTTLGGSTGGSWVRRNESDPAQNAHLALYTCPLASQINLTSGSAVGAGASNWFSWGCAFYQSVVAVTISVTASGIADIIDFDSIPIITPEGIASILVEGSAFLGGSNSLRIPSLEANSFVGNTMALVPHAFAEIASCGSSDVFSLFPYNTDEQGAWSFVQYGNSVFASNNSDQIQVYNLGSGGRFENLGGGSPKAKCIATVKNFLVAANTFDGDGRVPQRVRWSALDNPFSWTVNATTQADFQDLLGNGGDNQGIVIGLTQADAAILQERAVWRMTYQGVPDVFSFDLLEGIRGTPSPGSAITVGGTCYYLGEDGFYGFDGSQSIPIGQGKIDRKFQRECNKNLLYRMSSAADIVRKLIFWSVSTANAVDGVPDKIYVYNWGTGEWSILNIDTEILWRSQGLGYTLEDLDVFGDIDSIPVTFDSRQWSGKRMQLSAFDRSHRVAHFSGPNMAATITTRESTLGDPGRVFITKTWPLVDTKSASTGISVSVGTRKRSYDTVSFAIATGINSIGYCPQRSADHYIRFRLSISSCVTWDKVTGIDVETSKIGWR